MENEIGSEGRYVLGSEAEELARLDRQAAVIEGPTRVLLRSAGLAPGMRVLDVGTGLGHVARIAAEIVGASGSVVGIDQSAAALAGARQRIRDAATAHVTFLEGNAAAWRAPEPFDAVVGRLLLFHLADPAAAVRHHLQNLRRGGLFVAIDFDIGGSRTEPRVAIAEEVLRWVEQAFTAAGAWPRIGARLGVILEEAGLQRVTTFGVQAYLAPGASSGPSMLAGVVRSLAPVILREKIATAEQLDLETLERRIAEDVRRANAVFLPPTLAGAWGYAREDAPTRK